MKGKYSKLTGLFVAVAISITVFIFRDKFIDLKGYGYLGIFLISILGNATIILPVPVILTAFIGGSIFNPILVGIVTALGASIGELTGYLAGAAGQVVIEKDIRMERIRRWMHKYGIVVLFILAVIPNPVFDLAGIVAGATKIPVWKYLIVVFVGKLVKFIGISYLGAGSAAVLGENFGL